MRDHDYRSPENEFPVAPSQLPELVKLSGRPETEAQAIMETAPFAEPEQSLEELAPLLAAVRHAFDSLGDDDRMLLEAVVFERASFRQLSERWVVPRSTLHRWYSSAIEELKELMTDYPEVVAYLETKEHRNQ